VYKVVLLSAADKFFCNLYVSNRSHYERIALALEILKKDPYQGKILRHKLKGKYSLWVGIYRIIYAIEKQNITVYILKIGHRRDIYRSS